MARQRPLVEDTDASSIETGSDSSDYEDIGAASSGRQSRATSTVKSDRASSSSSSFSRRPCRRSTSARSSVILTPDEAHQYRIAGQPPDMELPGGNFPHSGLSSASGVKPATRRRIESDLAQLNPPVFLPGSARNSLRLKHLGVITTILHRCLLEGDYVRAGRAWGLILRDEWGGHAVDVRTEGRWGIGAEILLWRDGQMAAAGAEGGGGKGGYKTEWFSRRGFERAKQYYERLILHYPYRKHAPNALGPWISTRLCLDFGYRSFRRRVELRGRLLHMMYNMSMTSDPGREDRTKGPKLSARDLARELEEAQQIALSPDEAAEQGVQMGGDKDGDITMMSYDDKVDSILARMEEGLGMERRQAEVDKAKEFFERARARKVGPLSAADKVYMDSIDSY
uniref:Uncharacterized protein n=1 Tax=Coccidioides posadasii RMSCC 3488 TaxID=454284 RepID=A0A0J6FE88_COCPO|nr:hypothetical protein CPAG_04924 [Coccidioides posadasii RMSCC 3488]